MRAAYRCRSRSTKEETRRERRLGGMQGNGGGGGGGGFNQGGGGIRQGGPGMHQQHQGMPGGMGGGPQHGNHQHGSAPGGGMFLPGVASLVEDLDSAFPNLSVHTCLFKPCACWCECFACQLACSCVLILSDRASSRLPHRAGAGDSPGRAPFRWHDALLRPIRCAPRHPSPTHRIIIPQFCGVSIPAKSPT